MPHTETSDSGNESPCMEEEEEVVLVSDEDMAEEEDSYQILSTESVANDMEQTIKEVNVLVQLPPTSIRVLLNLNKWDKEKLLEAYYAEENSEKSHQPEKGKNLKMGDLFNCDICYSESDVTSTTSLECGHAYCNNCWSEYLTTKIMDEGASQTISCPTNGCDTLVDDQTIYRLITESEVKLKYQRLITNSFVECSCFMRWCPSAGCNKAVKVTCSKAQLIECVCGNQFCFSCLAQWHEPVSCGLFRRWCIKCKDDSETSNWIAANTKDCPKCSTTIEKNGGCNHMTCRKESCKYEFCWLCLDSWEQHTGSFYKCIKYESGQTLDAEKQNTTRAALEKYLFYFNRYANHSQSLKFERELHQRLEEKMTSTNGLDVPWIEIQFLGKASEILCQSRRTLMYTYVFAFYQEKSNQTEIFEGNQTDLQSATEKLSELLERDINNDNLMELKQKIIDQSIYCDARRQVLLDHVWEGVDKDLWSCI